MQFKFNKKIMKNNIKWRLNVSSIKLNNLWKIIDKNNTFAELNQHKLNYLLVLFYVLFIFTFYLLSE